MPASWTWPAVWPSPRAMAWLVFRRARGLVGRNETLGVEGALLRGIAWRHAVGLLGRRELPPRRLGGNASMPEAKEPGVIAHSRTQALFSKVQPLELEVRGCRLTVRRGEARQLLVEPS